MSVSDATPSFCHSSRGWLGVRLGLSLLVVGQSMIFGLALNLHEDVPGDVRFGAQTFLLLGTLLTIALLGGPLFSAAWRELRRGRLTIEALFLVTMTGAMGASLQAYFTGRGAIYFEVISILLVVYTVGREITARSLSWIDGVPIVPTACQSRVDLLGRIFLPLVMATAVGTFLYWAFFTAHGWETALFNAMSVLLVACPCVIGLATPVVMGTAIQRLAERGVIVRSADAIERLAEMDPDSSDENDARLSLVEIKNEVDVLPWVVAVCRDAVRAVKWNLYRAVAYNLVGMALAACGVLHPIAAALLMVVSSLSLVFSAMRVGGGCHREVAIASEGLEVSPPVATGGLAWVAGIHAMAFALQGFLIAELMGISNAIVIAFVVVGVMLARGWQRWAAIPHSLDMAFGMITLGNLGMLLGWWADLGFAPIHCVNCCSCEDPLAKPWMWIGMLLFANAGMIWCGRRPLAFNRTHTIAMFTGGNVGMLLGMFAGGAMAGEVEMQDTSFAAMLHFLGMTVGMIAGMFLGTWLVETWCGATRSTPVEAATSYSAG